MTSSTIVEAAGLLLVTFQQQKTCPDQFLLLRHHDRWDLPKGLLEAGETLLTTAIRETEEETGILSNQIQMLDGFSFALEYQASYQNPNPITFHKRVTFFLGHLSSPVDVHCTEHSGYHWFPWAPPHKIQSQTIDPLLAAAEQYFDRLLS